MMIEFLKNSPLLAIFFATFLAFLFGQATAMIAHRRELRRDLKRRIEDRQQDIFLDVLPVLSEWCGVAFHQEPNPGYAQNLSVKTIELQ